MIFGQSWDEPWYGKNSGVVQRLAAGPDDVELAGGHFLAVPGTIAAQIERVPLVLVHKPQRACGRQDQTQRVGADHPLPLAALVLPEPAKALASRMVISTAHRSRYWSGCRHAEREIGGEKCFHAGGGFLWPGCLGAAWPWRRTTTTRIRRPGNTVCHRPPGLDPAPASLGWGASPCGCGPRFSATPAGAFLARGAAPPGAGVAAAHRAWR